MDAIKLEMDVTGVESLEKCLEVACIESSLQKLPTTALHWAAHDGLCEVITALIHKGDVDLEEVDSYGRTAFLRAVVAGHAKATLLLHSHGCNPFVKDGWLRGAAHLASNKNHIELLHFMLLVGDDPNAQDDIGWSPLHTAAYRGYIAVASMLLDRGANIDSRDNYKRTPLHYAFRQNNQDMVRFLEKRGADMNAQDYRGIAPCDYYLAPPCAE